MALRSPWPCLVLAAALLTSAGCGPECGERQKIRYECENCGRRNDTRTFYESTLITGPLLHFPPQREYEFVHGLVGDITDVDISLSFQESAGSDAGLHLAPSGGNQAIYTVHPDEGTITVRNDVCAEFYIHVAVHSAILDDAGARD
jgi:hypothetical protein